MEIDTLQQQFSRSSIRPIEVKIISFDGDLEIPISNTVRDTYHIWKRATPILVHMYPILFLVRLMHEFFRCSSTAGYAPPPRRARWFCLLYLVPQVMQSGKCGCLDYDLTQGDDYLLIMGTMVFVSSYIDGYSADVQRQVIATLCSGIANDGDHLQVKRTSFACKYIYIYDTGSPKCISITL